MPPTFQTQLLNLFCCTVLINSVDLRQKSELEDNTDANRNKPLLTQFVHFNMVFFCVCVLTHWNRPHRHDLDAGLGVGVEAAVVDRVSNADVTIQRDGAEVHDGRCGEQDIQVDPYGTKVRGQRPPIICTSGRMERWREKKMLCKCVVSIWDLISFDAGTPLTDICGFWHFPQNLWTTLSRGWKHKNGSGYCDCSCVCHCDHTLYTKPNQLVWIAHTSLVAIINLYSLWSTVMLLTDPSSSSTYK